MYMYIIEYEIKVFFTQLEQNTLIIPLVSTFIGPLGSYIEEKQMTTGYLY